MIRRPPKSTFFPSTTSFRSGDRRGCPRAGRLGAPARAAVRGLLSAARHRRGRLGGADRAGPDAAQALPGEPRREDRSEEHTSELQSLAYLVCRLLLEKKKIN